MSRTLVHVLSKVALLTLLIPVGPLSAAPPVTHPSVFQELIGQIDELKGTQGPLGSLLLEELSAQNIGELLQTQWGVSLGNPLEDFDPALLYYLYSYFQVFPPDANLPIILEQTKQRGPELVRKEHLPNAPGLRLIFTQDAAAQVITQQVRQALATLKLNPQQPNTAAEVRISFQNALFEKLTTLLISYDPLVRIFSQIYHIDVSAETTGEIGQFSSEELSAILRPLVDLRPDILRLLKLKRITRMAHGITFTDPRNPQAKIIAVYKPETHEIQLTDEAFARRCNPEDPRVANDNLTPPELQPDEVCTIDESFVHELGHAVWAGLPPQAQAAFRAISWQAHEKLWQPKSDHTQFFSPQSMQNPDEDFAEHFRAYLNHAAQMLVISPEKVSFFQALLFPNTTYLRNVHERLRVQVDSDQPDVAPPHLSDSLRNSVQIAVLESTATQTTIAVTIQNLSDDISGIEQIRLNLTSQDHWYTIALPLRMTHYQPDQKRFYREFRIQNGQLSIPEEHVRQTIYTGTYRLTHVTISDRAQNRLQFSIPAADFPPLQIQANTRCSRKTKCMDPDAKKALESGIGISRVETPEPFDTFHIRIPLPHSPDLRNLSLRWQSDSGQQIPDILIQFFRSRPGNEAIEFDFQFSDRLEPDVLHLSNINLTLAETSEFFSEHPQYILDYRSHPNLSLTITPANPYRAPFHLEINEIPKPSVEQTQQPNPSGGNRTIKILIPVEELGLENGDQISVSVRTLTPQGKPVMSNRVLSSSALRDSTLTQEGRQYWVVPIELPPNNEAGTYQIDYLQLTKTIRTSPPPAGANRQSGHWQILKFNLQEREIQTKFRIQILDN